MSKIALFRIQAFQFVFSIVLVLGIGIAWAMDSDNDGMSDVYENFFRLDAANGVDAANNYDNDLLGNLQESQGWTDPFSTDTDGDGFPDHADSNALSRAVMFWGASNFTVSNRYDYPGPYWFAGAVKSQKGGIWESDSWYVPAGTNAARLDLLLDHSMLFDDLVMAMLIEDNTKTSVHVDLWDDEQCLARDIVGNITGFGREVKPKLKYFRIPLSQYPDTTKIRIRRMANRGDFRLYYTALYIDNDGDGLDADQELQLGTSDFNPDSDGDGMGDREEATTKYRLIERFLTWPEARREAELRGGHLLTVTSEEEHEQILELWKFGKQCPWIGATDEEDEGVWKWVTDEPFDFQLWGMESPDNNPGLGGEDFASYDFEDVWRDEGLGIHRMYIIEYDQALDPSNPDTDGDGLLDGEEYALGCSPLSADSDGDGISDGDEIAAGLNPLRVDTDRDGLTDYEEILRGFDPLDPDMDGDGLKDGDEMNITLTDPLEMFTIGSGTNDLVLERSLRGVETTDRFAIHVSSQWADANDDLTLTNLNNFTTYVEYYIEAKTAGIHQVALQARMEGFEMQDTHEPRIELFFDGCFSGRLQWNTSESLPAFTGFTPWLTVGHHKLTVHVYSPALRHSLLVIERVELHSINGLDANNDGIQDWMETQLALGLDSDGDGLSDEDEVRIHGTDPLDADTDGDGLSDADELAAGTDPLDEDSDNDGVLDGVEVHEAFTNPLEAEFDGSVTVISSISGSQTNHAVGNWIIEGSELLSKSRRGYVEYTLDFPKQDLYRLNVNVAHSWTKSSCAPVLPKDTSAFLVYVDGIYVGKFPLVSADGVYVDVGAFLPVMPAGEHTIKLYWENVHSRLAVKINHLQLQSLGGPDADGNGVKDWIETSIAAMAGVDTSTLGIPCSEFGVLQSFVSPACIEGNARYVPLATLSSSTFDIPCSIFDIHQSVGSRWYANLPLEQDGTTVATATFQNGALEVPVNVEWVPYNLMEHNGEILLVRKGDMVKFVALPDDANGGQFEIEYLLDVEGETVRSPNTRPLIYLFPSAGTYTVSGEYRKGNQTTTASIQVKAIDGSFPTNSPACLVGREREWTVGGFASNVVFEVDSSVELSELSTTNQALRTVSLKANDTNGDHIILARLYPGGSILDSGRLLTFWIQNAVDGYFYTVECYEDYELWEVQSVAKNVPDSIDIQIKVIVAGVMLDDYTLERWLTNADYDEISEYNLRLFHPNESEGSTCHTFKVYQNGVMIGEAFSGGQNTIEAE